MPFRHLLCALVAITSAASMLNARLVQAENETTFTYTLQSCEENVFKKVNAIRAQHGLEPLVMDNSLMESARRHCAWMAKNGHFQHTKDPVGENIAMGQVNSGHAVTDWMNSPGHKANILHPKYRKTGVAAYTAPDGKTYWCQQFLY